METTIWILSTILYVFTGVVVEYKQYHTGNEIVPFGFLFWPVVLAIYTIRVWFFEDWI